jgi:hypothetical protein
MERVYFETINNKKIFCYLSEEPVNAQKKMVIMVHGFRGANDGPARQFVDFQRLLNKEGFSVLRIDLPNSGNSDGDYIDVSYDEWVNTIVYFAKKYLNQGYKVALLGQSMGAAATVIATSKQELKGKIPCILLWVPGVNDGDFKGGYDEIFEEAGQKYKGKFWIEAHNADFFKCLEEYKGGIHLVYGEKDRYISQDLRDKVIRLVKEKGQPFMVLKGQDHSPWEYDLVQEVYKAELARLKEYTK